MPPSMPTNSQAQTALNNGVKGLATKALFTKKKKKPAAKVTPITAKTPVAPASPVSMPTY